MGSVDCIVLHGEERTVEAQQHPGNHHKDLLCSNTYATGFITSTGLTSVLQDSVLQGGMKCMCTSTSLRQVPAGRPAV